MNGPVRVALVGAGRIGRDYAAAARDLPCVELVGASDPDPQARADWPHPDVPIHADPRAFTQNGDRPAGAIVCTPPASHERPVQDLLRAGIDVLCEKPLAESFTPCERMFEEARRNRRRLMAATKFRFVDDVSEAKQLIEQRALGEPVFFEISFCGKLDVAGSWRADRKVSGGGVLADNGVHAFDLVRHLLGPVVRVFAYFGRRVQPIEVEDTVRVQVETVGGCIGQVDLSWSIDRHDDRWFALHGSEGTLELRWQGSRWRRNDGEWTPLGKGYDKMRALRAQIEHFAAVLQNKVEPLVDRRQAMDTLRLLEAAYESARNGRWAAPRSPVERR